MKRQGLMHLMDMKPDAFLSWLDSVKSEASGILSKQNVRAALKIDGMGFRFGKSKAGNVFIEGSRTGPQFASGAFSAYARSKSTDEVVIQRATQYDDILEHFKKNKKLMDLLPNNAKVYCELFYVPMAQVNDDTGVQFVTIRYDRAKIGSLMTVSIYDVLDAETNQKHPDAENIKQTLIQKGSTKEVKVVSADLDFIGEIDIGAEIDLVDSLIKNKTQVMATVSSRKKEDAVTKQNVLQLINQAKRRLSDKILFNSAICGQDMFCDVDKGEGLVLHLPKGLPSIKITSSQFQQAHHGSVR